MSKMGKAGTDFSIDMLKGLSAIVMKNTGSTYNTLQGSFDASKGDLRLLNVTAGAGGRSYMNFLKVPDRLADFCTRVNARRRSLHDGGDIFEQYLLSFDAHYKLVTIHPWADGNGRMSRLVMNHLQFEYGLVPTKINKDDKAAYIQALVDSREQDSMDSFREFMLQEHIKNLQQEISTFKEAMEEVETKGGQETGKVDRKGGQKTREAILDMIADDARITLTQMAERIGINRSAISKHLKKLQENGIIRREGPDKGGKWCIIKASTCKEYLQVQQEGKRMVSRTVKYYDLDVIISVGYRVKSKRGTAFRIWARNVIKDYLVKGYAVNERIRKEQIGELRQLVGMLGRTIQSQPLLSTDESNALFEVVTDYTYAPDTSDTDLQQEAMTQFGERYPAMKLMDWKRIIEEYTPMIREAAKQPRASVVEMQQRKYGMAAEREDDNYLDQ